jgi:non-ribosomal peptide synthetase component F
VQWANDYAGVRAGDRQPLEAPIASDWAIFEVVGTLAAGAAGYLVPEDLDRFPHRVGDFIRRWELTWWSGLSETMVALAEADVIAPGDFPELRNVFWPRGAMLSSALRYWMARLAHVRFTALYNSSGSTVASAFYTIPRSSTRDLSLLPIGTACPGEEILLLDDELDSVRAGTTGEVYVRGVGVSPGYWRDPERTRDAFRTFSRNPDGSDRIYRTGDLGERKSDGHIYLVGQCNQDVESRVAAGSQPPRTRP